MVLEMARQGGWTSVWWWAKTLKTMLNLKGAFQALVHSGQMVLVVDRQGGITALTVDKDAQGW
jgi:hypothetical protein